MINSQKLAHAVAIVTGGIFVICRVLAAVVPSFIFSIGNSWFHTLTLDAAQARASMTAGSFVLGLVSSVVVAWLVTYAVVEVYKRLAK